MQLITRRAALAVSIALASTSVVLAQDAYPSRPIRVIVNTAPGGLTDVITRLVTLQMGEHLKQTLIVDNRAGGDGLIGIRAAKTAPADGYTLLATAGTIALQMAVRNEPGYDLTKDFVGIGPMGRSPFLLVSAPTQPYKTLPEFVALAKSNPDKLTFGSAGSGTVPHLGTEKLFQQLGLKLQHVPYKGNGPAMPDVMSGRVDVIFEAYGSSAGSIKGGRLRVLAVTGNNRLAALPDVPTVAEQGLPGYAWYTWLSLTAPAGTPKDVVQKLSEALRAAMASKVVMERFRQDGMETMNMTPDEFNLFLAQEVMQAHKTVTELGIPKQ
jgi:tripartite-type tricarboxylate transporter receptor subunit TctC